MLKNYTTKVPASQSITEIQTALVRHGATGVLFEYEQGTGRIAAERKKELGEEEQLILRGKNNENNNHR